MLNLKIKLLFYQQKKWIYSGIAENYNSRQARYDKTIDKSREQRRVGSSTEEVGELGRLLEQETHWSKIVGVQSIVASHGWTFGGKPFFLLPRW